MDLTQEAFVAGFSALDRYDGDRPFRTWIAHIALNKCHDWARRRKVRAYFSRALPLESAHHIASDGPAPDSVAPDRRESRSEGRGGGNGCGSTFSCRWSPKNQKKINIRTTEESK